jgi:hypothetical protein
MPSTSSIASSRPGSETSRRWPTSQSVSSVFVGTASRRSTNTGGSFRNCRLGSDFSRSFKRLPSWVSSLSTDRHTRKPPSLRQHDSRKPRSVCQLPGDEACQRWADGRTGREPGRVTADPCQRSQAARVNRRRPVSSTPAPDSSFSPVSSLPICSSDPHVAVSTGESYPAARLPHACVCFVAGQTRVKRPAVAVDLSVGS